MYTILMVVHSIIVLFLIMMVLVQRTDGDGLGGLGGGGGNQFLTGRATANLLTRTTAILAALFMLSSLVLAVMGGHLTGRSIIDTAVPIETSTPAATDKPAVESKESVPEEKTREHSIPVKKASPAVPKPE